MKEIKLNLDDPDYQKLSTGQLFQAERTMHDLRLLHMMGIVQDHHLEGRVLDFGCGDGGSSYAHMKLGAHVTAVDVRFDFPKKLQGIVSDEDIIRGDGIKYMSDHPDTFDLIAAWMLDPHIGMQPYTLDRFVRAARSSLKEGGRILLHSDGITMRRVFNQYGDQGNPFPLLPCLALVLYKTPTLEWELPTQDSPTKFSFSHPPAKAPTGGDTYFIPIIAPHLIPSKDEALSSYIDPKLLKAITDYCRK